MGGFWRPSLRDSLRMRRFASAFDAGLSGSDPLFADVASLLHFDGEDGDTTLIDQKGHAWTVSGNAQIDTSQSLFGGASLLVDGAGDFVTASDAAFAPGTGVFTVEFAFRPATTSGIQILFDQRPDGLQAVCPTIYSDGGTLKYFVNGVDIFAGGTLTVGVQNRIALCRNAGLTRMYLGGSQVGSTYTDTNNYTQTRVRLAASGLGANLFANGHFDEFRLTRAARMSGSSYALSPKAFQDS